MKERFSVTELAALRSDLLQGGMIDSYEAAELLQVFLMGRGYGVSPKAALDAAGRVEMAGCALPVLQFELRDPEASSWVGRHADGSVRHSSRAGC